MLAIKSVSCCSGYSFVGYTLSCQTCFVTAQPLPQHSSTWTRVGVPRSWVCTRLTLHQQKFHSKHIWAEQSASTSLMSNGKKQVGLVLFSVNPATEPHPTPCGSLVERLRIQRKEKTVQPSSEPFPVFINLPHFSPASRQGLLYSHKPANT